MTAKKELTNNMLSAARNALFTHWEKVEPKAGQELISFADAVQYISQMSLANEISAEEAQYYLAVQKSNMRLKLLTVEGLSIATIEGAIMAALNTFNRTVN